MALILRCSTKVAEVLISAAGHHGLQRHIEKRTRRAKSLCNYQGGPISPNSSKINSINHIKAIIQPITQTTFRSKSQLLHISTKHAIVNMAMHIIPMGRNRLVHKIQLVAAIDHMHIFASTLRVRSSTNLRCPFITPVLFRMPKHIYSPNTRGYIWYSSYMSSY